jgi:hypothetical protein
MQNDIDHVVRVAGVVNEGVARGKFQKNARPFVRVEGVVNDVVVRGINRIDAVSVVRARVVSDIIAR